MTGAPRVAQTTAERFRIMPPQDEVVGRADWYRPRMRVVGVNSAATRAGAATGGATGAPKDSIERFGAARGAWLATKRIARCTRAASPRCEKSAKPSPWATAKIGRAHV